MTRIRVFAATFAVALAAAPAAFGSANPRSHGVDAPGQANAGMNCGEAISRLTDNGVEAGGGPKKDIPAPINCDHFFAPPGQGQ